jgi:hypothetical protein
MTTQQLGAVHGGLGDPTAEDFVWVCRFERPTIDYVDCPGVGKLKLPQIGDYKIS